MSPSVVKLFQQQFQNDFSLFLKLRFEELVFGGQIILTFIGRKYEDVFNGEPNHLYGLIAQSLQSLVDEVNLNYFQPLSNNNLVSRSIKLFGLNRAF